MAQKVRLCAYVLGFLAIAAASPLRAADAGYQPQTFSEQLVSSVVYCGLGIFMAIIGFRLFDLVTPGKLDKEIVEKQNMAAGIMAAAIILGICIIVASVVA